MSDTVIYVRDAKTGVLYPLRTPLNPATPIYRRDVKTSELIGLPMESNGDGTYNSNSPLLFLLGS